MRIKVYPFQLLDTGEIPQEPEAVIVWEDGKTRIQTQNKELEAKLDELYSRSLKVRRSVSSKGEVMAFKEEQIFPDTEEFFKESVYLMRELNLYGELEGEKKVQLVALDFDGTLWDSVHECFVLTCQAFKKLGWLIPPLADLEEKFKQGRFFVRFGEEFFLLMNWIIQNPLRNPQSISPEEEEALRQTDGNRALFEQTFYALRREWREKNFFEWCALQQPYPGILEQVQELQKRFSKVVVATTKDTDSVKRLLSVHKISLDVVGKENTVDKMKQISLISSTYKKPFHQIVFVDDLLEQVKAVKSLGAKVALAGWGYSSKRQRDEAESINIPILKLPRMAEMLVQLF